jgi:hypothetical protein
MSLLRFAPHVFAAGALLACSLTNSLDDYQRGAVDGGAADAVADGPVGDADSCDALTLPPQRPSGGDTGDVTFTVAIKSLVTSLKSKDGTGVGGFDLDGVRSCPGAGSCTPAAAAPLACDQCGGIDNSLTRLVDQVTPYVGPAAFDPAGEITSGTATLIAIVSGWNGTPNDPIVSVGAVPAAGIETSSSGNSRPAFDGKDVWAVDGLGVVPNVKPTRLRDTVDDAYVRDGFLVARVNFLIRFGGAGVVTKDSKFVARITPFKDSYQLSEGIIAGRITTQALLTNWQYTPDPLNPSVYLCKGNKTYGALRKQICEFRDIAADPTKDRVTGARCDAIRFEAVPAIIGRSQGRPIPAFPCPGGSNYVDDCD